MDGNANVAWENADVLEVLSFGCRLNHAESQAIRQRAAEAGLADAVVVNSCGVTAEAVRQVKQGIRRAKRAYPDRPVIVTGCAAEIEPATFAAMPEVDRIVANRGKLDAASYATPAVIPPGAHAGWIEAPLAPGGRVRAFLDVQSGCDHGCTFCVIPVGRGRSRSRPTPDVIREVRRFTDAGVGEVVLTGVDITAWGEDLGADERLGDLVRAILAEVPELPRLRLSSVDPVEVDEALLAAFADEERLMPHLHLSLQHGDDVILKRMKRRHRRGDAIALAAELRRRRADLVLGADLIAGFPTETEAMFASSLAIVAECGLALLHVFPYSVRPGTPASRMPQLDRGLAKERALRLREYGEAALAARLDREVGRRRRVLVEQPGVGRTEHFFQVELAGEAAPTGALIEAQIGGRRGQALTANLSRAA